MDCGPAALKALLEGFGVRASYGRLREACQIDLDGTSIDTVEEVANELGLEAEQILIPADHVFLAEAKTLPAVVVVTQPNGLNHFIVVWSRHGRFVQIMDPSTGRRWVRQSVLRRQIYHHRHLVSAADWRDWAGSEEFLEPLRARIRRLGLSGGDADHLVEQALADRTWRGPAGLDACVRLVEDLVASGGVKDGSEARRVLSALFDDVRVPETPDRSADETCPPDYWSVRRAEVEGAREEQLWFHGSVLVRVKASTEADGAEGGSPDSTTGPSTLSPELVAALTEPDARPGRTLLDLLWRAGRWLPVALLGLLAVAAGGVVFEAVLFRGFIDIGRDLAVSHQRLVGLGLLGLFLILLFAIELPAVQAALRLGRHLENLLRVAFLQKIPRLKDRYFASRLTSDMAERGHNVHKLRRLPDLAEWFTRSFMELLVTVGGILWLDPGSLVPVLVTTAVALVLPFVSLPLIQELDLRVRNHHGALGRFYLDALLGLAPIRAHGAERAVTREHEALLLDWSRAHFLREKVTLAADAVLHVATVGMVAWIILGHLARNGLTGSVLLLVYWSLSLFSLSQLVSVMLGRQYPSYRNITLRLLEPLGAPEDQTIRSTVEAGPDAPEDTAARGAREPADFVFQNVAVRAAGHTILRDINLQIGAGEHVAVVGPSGAGKSTLVGLLLGWHQPQVGRVLVDGEPLEAAQLPRLRQETAWVDPAIQLWNRSLLENLRYGLPPEANPEVSPVIDQADLVGVLEMLPDGLQGAIGESGGLVSGGEGQRVRLARAMLRPSPRLVILDEPFRGLDRGQRSELLKRARSLWSGTTLLCVTHDVAETRDFPRVIVVEQGHIVEDGSPAKLSELSGSRYRAMLAAEEAVREGMWSASSWRRFRIDSGWLLEQSGGPR